MCAAREKVNHYDRNNLVYMLFRLSREELEWVKNGAYKKQRREIFSKGLTRACDMIEQLGRDDLGTVTQAMSVYFFSHSWMVLEDAEKALISRFVGLLPIRLRTVLSMPARERDSESEIVQSMTRMAKAMMPILPYISAARLDANAVLDIIGEVTTTRFPSALGSSLGRALLIGVEKIYRVPEWSAGSTKAEAGRNLHFNWVFLGTPSSHLEG